MKAGTKNLEAYQLYLKGRALLFRKGSAIPRALECFERAVGLAPDYAQAWAGVADSHTSLGYYGFARPEATMPKGMESARRSVALDPSLAEAHNALAMACLMGAWDKAEAEREFFRAPNLNPRYVQARDWYALFYLQFAEGRLQDGVAQAKLALESDPLSSYAHAIYSFTCALAEKHAEAVQPSRRAVELDSESYLASRDSRGCPVFKRTVRGSCCCGRVGLGDIRPAPLGRGCTCRKPGRLRQTCRG